MAWRITGALAVLMGIQIIDMLEVTNTILDRNLGVAGLGFTPCCARPLCSAGRTLAALAGSLFAFGKLASEAPSPPCARPASRPTGSP